MTEPDDNHLLVPVPPLRRERVRQLGLVSARHGLALLRMLAAERGRGFPELGALQLRLAFQSLGPTFVKMGQFVSSSPGTFPRALVDEFAHCQDAVPPEPWAKVATILEADLGDLRSRFRWIDWRPIASGSIAQVHGAELLDGEQVVIKVQRSDLEQTLRQDLRMMMAGARLLVRLRPGLAVANPIGVVEDFASSLAQELSFRREASHMEEVRVALDGWPVVIPHVHAEFTTERVLVMERLVGAKVSDLDAISRLDIPREGIADLVIGSFFSTALRAGTFHGDGHAGNIFVLADGRLGLLDFGIVGRLRDDERIAVSRFLRALFEQRYDDVVTGIIELTGVEMADMDDVVDELGEIAGRYLGGPLGDMQMGALFGELLGSANRHGMSLPTNHVLLFKQLLYLDGLCRVLNPDFDVFRDGMRYASYFAPEADGAPADSPQIPCPAAR